MSNSDSSNEALINTFYAAFQRRDGAAMAACYHPEAEFSDPVFPGLKGSEPGEMWKMLCSRANDLKVEFSAVQVNGSQGKAHWEAWYTFSATGRKVHNIIDAEFEFKDGKILRHRDSFDFWAWSRQALGPAGWVAGWSSVLQNKVRAQAAKGLSIWIAKAQEAR